MGRDGVVGSINLDKWAGADPTKHMVVKLTQALHKMTIALQASIVEQGKLRLALEKKGLNQ